MTPTWRTISASMVREQPVFIGGLARSGTTALRQTLQRLPAFRSHTEESRETRVFQSPLRVVELAPRDERRFAMYLQSDEAVDLLRNALEPLVPKLPRRVVIGALHRAGLADGMFAWRLSRGRHVVRVFFHVAKATRGFDRILEKTPGTERYMDRVLDAFPRARVLICERDPVDVFASFRKRAEIERVEGLADTGFGIDVEQFIERWAASAAASARAVALGAMIVPYEDLTTDPQATLRSICAFISEPFNETLLIDERDEVRRPRWGLNAVGRLAPNPSNWQQFVGEDEAALIRARCTRVPRPQPR